MQEMLLLLLSRPIATDVESAENNGLCCVSGGTKMLKSLTSQCVVYLDGEV